MPLQIKRSHRCPLVVRTLQSCALNSPAWMAPVSPLTRYDPLDILLNCSYNKLNSDCWSARFHGERCRCGCINLLLRCVMEWETARTPHLLCLEVPLMSRAVEAGAPGVHGVLVVRPVGQAPWADKGPAPLGTLCTTVVVKTFTSSNASTLPALVRLVILKKLSRDDSFTQIYLFERNVVFSPQLMVSGCHGRAGPIALPPVEVCRSDTEAASLLATAAEPVLSSQDHPTCPCKSVSAQKSKWGPTEQIILEDSRLTGLEC